MCNKHAEWEICSLGNWNVVLYDKLFPNIRFNMELLDKIFRQRLNVFKLLLILDENGFKDKKGAAFCYKLQQYIRCVTDRKCFSRALRTDMPIRPNFPEWDYAVVLPRKSVKFIKKEPAYFTFLLGHELEHVELYSSDYDTFALHAGWLFDNLKRLPYYKEEWRYTFPVEKHCNKTGKKLAIALFSEQQFIDAIKRVSESKSEEKNQDVFSWLITVPQEKPCLNLRKEFIGFCEECKEDLRKIFDKDLDDWEQTGKRPQDKPFAAEINNFEDMFDLNYKTRS
jgi:hypothetical protein